VTESRLKDPAAVFGLDVSTGSSRRSSDPHSLEARLVRPRGRRGDARRAAGQEAAAFGINWTYAPMVDIAPDPRWGRIAEARAEDPYLGSLMAARPRARLPAERSSRRLSTSPATARRRRAANTTKPKSPNAPCARVYLPAVQGRGRCGRREPDVGIPTRSPASRPPATPGSRTPVLRREWAFSGLVVSD